MTQIPVLETRKLSKQYNSRTILNRIDFKIAEGQIYCLLGINGAGKSSLISILASLHLPSEGEVLWKGRSLYQQLSAYRQFVGYCPQEQSLDQQLTLKQILLFQGKYYGLNNAKAEMMANHLIQQFELDPYSESLPFLLSGGFKQRFVIAKTLMHSPRFLILDEPSVGLDAIARAALWGKILNLKRDGITILFTTHYLSEAEKYADRVCVLHQGCTQIDDTPSNLKEKRGSPDFEAAFVSLLNGEVS